MHSRARQLPAPGVAEVFGHKSPIPRSLPRESAHEWLENRPTHRQADAHLQRIVENAPKDWRTGIERRFARIVERPPMGTVFGSDEYARWDLGRPPQSYAAWDRMQAMADWEDLYGQAVRLNMSDAEICTWANKLVDDVCELDALVCKAGAATEARVDMVRKIARIIGIQETKPITGEPAILRAKCPKWWRKQLRALVVRTVEAGYIAQGMVHLKSGGYVSHSGLRRRKGQNARNDENLKGIFMTNEAGQVYSLASLSALGVSNPVIRGGELMTRIRGAEEYADARAHVGMFLTLTVPSRFHRMKLVQSGKYAVFNDKWSNETTPREAQQWLCDRWQRVRQCLDRRGIKRYGLRVAEPHHDGTPHWHMLMWVECEADAVKVEEIIRKYWLIEDERGAKENRVDVKRLTAGGAAGYVAKYIAKNVGNHALAEHRDVVDGNQLSLLDGTDEIKADPSSSGYQGYKRVDAWKACWGIRQFQFFGMPSVTGWREARRVSHDQLELFDREGDPKARRIAECCHREGNKLANWRDYMEAMGGHSLKRHEWHLRVVRDDLRPGASNRYGEELKFGPIVGLVPQHGRMAGHWLISRRIGWRPLAGATTTHAAQSASADAMEHGADAAAERQALPAAWTGFNNCTGRSEKGARAAAERRQNRRAGPRYSEEPVNYLAAMQESGKWD